MPDIEFFPWETLAPKSLFEAAMCNAAVLIERESELVPYEGPRGGKGRKNPATGRVYYDVDGGVDAAAMASPSVRDATQKALDSGLGGWVEMYKHWRHAGNVGMAKKTRDAIKGAIKKYELDPEMVWGPDPDAPDVRDAEMSGNSETPQGEDSTEADRETEGGDAVQDQQRLRWGEDLPESPAVDPQPASAGDDRLENTAISRQATGMSGREINLVNRALGIKQRKEMRGWTAKDLSDAVDAIKKSPLQYEKKQRIEELVIGERFRRVS